ncbi:hypothetical protein QIS99_00555 [Streptomyces sp. B-S-A8]|uniref:Uncharacterized protein n=1 Tax=Streptomyces solicavernae TaxID=3043614 RepID=A0ABT6RJV9_9ACTN|nr:hypothetical protein [Streptomyces sp. B-S-A8]MDI3384717.1 hypothetical protein [Streptomyces sp. B-S-A8]
MAVTAVVCAAGIVLDDRVLVGSPIWFKPFKFAVSFVAYCLSLAWLLAQLPPGGRAARVGRWAGAAVAVSGLAEMVIIVGQVVRGRRSHFNVATPFDAALFALMGATIVVLWAATLVIAVLLLRARIADRAAALAMRAGIALALAGAAVGYVMTQPTPGQRSGEPDVVGAHSVGVPDGGPSMPLTGWSTTGGDLRIPHFFGMHALQLLPLLVVVLLLLARRVPRLRSERVRSRLVGLASLTYAAVFALLVQQALRGQPLLSPDATTLTETGLILAATAVGVWLILRSQSRADQRAVLQDKAGPEPREPRTTPQTDSRTTEAS